MARSQAEIADEIEVAATWVTGARSRRLQALAADLRGEEPPAPTPQEQRDAERADRRAQEAEARAAAAEQARQAAEAASTTGTTPTS